MTSLKNENKIEMFSHLWPCVQQKACKSVLKCDCTSQALFKMFSTRTLHMCECVHTCGCTNLFYATHSLLFDHARGNSSLSKSAKIQCFPSSMLIFGQKSCVLGPIIIEIPQPNRHYTKKQGLDFLD